MGASWPRVRDSGLRAPGGIRVRVRGHHSWLKSGHNYFYKDNNKNFKGWRGHTLLPPPLTFHDLVLGRDGRVCQMRLFGEFLFQYEMGKSNRCSFQPFFEKFGGKWQWWRIITQIVKSNFFFFNYYYLYLRFKKTKGSLFEMLTLIVKISGSKGCKKFFFGICCRDHMWLITCHDGHRYLCMYQVEKTDIAAWWVICIC